MNPVNIERIAKKWAAVKPKTIAQECSQRHIQSVIEEMQTQIATLCQALAEVSVTEVLSENWRQEEDSPFKDTLADWVRAQTKPFTMGDAALYGLGLPADKLTHDTQTHVGIALRKLDCRVLKTNTGEGRKITYLPPELVAIDAGHPTSSCPPPAFQSLPQESSAHLETIPAQPEPHQAPPSDQPAADPNPAAEQPQ